MRHRVRHVEKEWPLMILVDEAKGLSRAVSRDIAHALRSDIRVDNLPVPPQLERRVCLWSLRVPWPHIIRIRVAKREIKPVVVWMEHFLMPKVPFTYDSCRVAAGFQHFTDCLFIGGDTVFGVWSQCSVDADTVWVTSREKSRTACTAHSLCRIKAGKAIPASGEVIKVWCWIRL